jgi:hypothetical protein
MENNYDNIIDANNFARIELIAKSVNGKQVFFIVDCDKSFCNVCDKETCTLENFFQKNPSKSKIFVNELYNHTVKKHPGIKSTYKNKHDVITFALNRCSGYDNYYDLLFKGDKLLSVKYDDYMNLRKKRDMN